MRNKDRIDVICDAIREVWKKHPDLRLGQLICNIANSKIPLFYIEDDMMLDMINEWNDSADKYRIKLYEEDEEYRDPYDTFFGKKGDDNG